LAFNKRVFLVFEEESIGCVCVMGALKVEEGREEEEDDVVGREARDNVFFMVECG